MDAPEAGSQIVVIVTHRLVYTRFWGVTTGATLLAVRVQLLQDPHFDPSFDVIVDLREADLSPLKSSEIEALASRSAFRQSTRRAIIADTADKFGLSRMYQIHRDLAGGAEETRVVMALTEALDWLGLDARALMPLLAPVDADLADC